MKHAQKNLVEGPFLYFLICKKFIRSRHQSSESRNTRFTRSIPPSKVEGAKKGDKKKIEKAAPTQPVNKNSWRKKKDEHL